MRNRQVSLVAFLLIVIFLTIAVLSQRERELKQIGFSDLMTHVESHEVRSLTIKGSQIDGELTDGSHIRTVGPTTDYYLQKFGDNGVTPSLRKLAIVPGLRSSSMGCQWC